MQMTSKKNQSVNSHFENVRQALHIMLTPDEALGRALFGICFGELPIFTNEYDLALVIFCK